ncbi:MAG: hypothetical protein FD151_2105, partial [bacterium]
MQCNAADGLFTKPSKIGLIIDQTGTAAFVGIPYSEAVRNYFRYVGNKSKFYKGDLDKE